MFDGTAAAELDGAALVALDGAALVALDAAGLGVLADPQAARLNRTTAIAMAGTLGFMRGSFQQSKGLTAVSRWPVYTPLHAGRQGMWLGCRPSPLTPCIP